MSWQGMSAATGRTLSETDHIIQSVRDILATPVGSRLMRRHYGSELFYLIDQPQHAATRLRMMAAIVDALTRWEPRIKIRRVEVGAQGLQGALVITLTWSRADNGLTEHGSLTLPTGINTP